MKHPRHIQPLLLEYDIYWERWIYVLLPPPERCPGCGAVFVRDAMLHYMSRKTGNIWEIEGLYYACNQCLGDTYTSAEGYVFRSAQEIPFN